MKTFLDKHESKITGVLSCFDRMLFRGYLPIMSGAAMAQFLNQEGIKFRDLKSCLLEHAATLKAHAQSKISQPQYAILWRQGSDELSWEAAGRAVSKRGGE